MLQLLLLLAWTENPPQYPAYYTAHNITQPADHFNFKNNATFQHRYLLNDTHWGGPSFPVIFYTGAEGNGVDSIFTHSGYLLELAQTLKALVVFGEMRFFGESMPFGEEGSMKPTVDRIGLLSVEQALGDYAALIEQLRSDRGWGFSPVISVGGSLAGTLAYMLRVRYPHLVHMAMASSAPILGYPGLADPMGWYKVATTTYDTQAPGCSDMVRAGFSALEIADAAALSKAFNACTPILPSQRGYVKGTLVGQITTALACAAESAYPKSISPVVANCKAIAKAGGGAGRLAPIVVHPGTCLNISNLDVLASQTTTLLKPTPPSPPPSSLSQRRRQQQQQHRPQAALTSASEALPPPAEQRWLTPPTVAQLRHYAAAIASGQVEAPKLTGAQSAAMSWYYLACTEIIHPIGADNVTDMFPPQPWSLAGTSGWCRSLFGVTPQPKHNPQQFGMDQGAASLPLATSHVIFTNGVLDPWYSQSVVKDPPASSTLVAINIEDGSHHSDLGAPSNPYPSSEDSAPLKAARATQLQYLKTWIAEHDEMYNQRTEL